MADDTAFHFLLNHSAEIENSRLLTAHFKAILGTTTLRGTMHRIIRLKEVKSVTGLARSTIYKKIAADDFPTQISLGPKAVGWLESDIQGWINHRISQSL